MSRLDTVESEAGGGRIWPIVIMILIALAMIAGGLWFLLALYQPPPQKVVVMSTGTETGAYHIFGRRYQAVLARSGVRLDLKPSRGSIENLERLNEAKSDIMVTLLQGGIGEASTAPRAISIGRMFHEPLWVFYSDKQRIERLTDVRSLRVAIGPEGSGTRKLSLAVLEASKVDSTQATFIPLGGTEAANALLAGEADVIMLVGAPETPVIQRLIRAKEVKLLSMVHAEALGRRFPYLDRVVLPRGTIDLELDLPQTDVTLVAPIASLVVSDSLHPAIVSLLAQAAAEVHSGGSLMQKPGDFPQAVDPQFPMSADAIRIYRSGPPFLQRYLPFWVANLVERMALLLLPIATVALPLSRMLPSVYRWRMRRRLNYWYGRLAQLEVRIRRDSSEAVVAAQHAELGRIREAVQQLKVPNAFAEQYYTLRNHIDFVAGKLGLQN